MQERLEKMAKMREKRRNVNIMDRIRPIIAEIERETSPAAATTGEEPKRALQVFRRDIYYSYSGSRGTERGEIGVQTEIAKEEERRVSIIRKARGSVDKPAIVERESVGTDPLAEESREQIRRLRAQQTTPVKIAETKKEKGEAKVVENNPRFRSFFMEASKFVEKALRGGEKGGDRAEDSGESKRENRDERGGDKLAERGDRGVESEFRFELPGDLRGQLVTCLDWSGLIPEVCLTVQGEQWPGAWGRHYQDRIYVWNSKFHDRPEFELYSGARVSRARFSPFHSEYVVSGLECGRLYLYDLRAKKEPVLKSLPISEGHKTTISGLDFIGGQNSSNVVSTSEEGKLCLWTLNKMDYPVKSVEIFSSDKKKDDEISFPLEPICLSTVPGDTSSVFIGAADSNVYQCAVLGTSPSEKLLEKPFKGHTSVVTALDHNRTSDSSLLGHAMLSGSLDWTVKLWSLKRNEPLYSFPHHLNPITDVNWNPAHPGLFVSADSEGLVRVVDLFTDLETPVWSSKEPGCVLNAKWDSTGRFLALSNTKGNVVVKKFAQALLHSKTGDLAQLEKTLA